MDILKKYNYDEKLFERLREKFLSGEISEKNNVLHVKVEPPDNVKFFNPQKDTLLNEKLISIGSETIKRGELGVVIVNGGMATRFGGVVKAVVEVYDGKSFLQIKLEQIKKINEKYAIKVPIYLMNSFFTEDTTIEYLKKNNYFGLKDSINCFNQFVSKRLNCDGTRLSDEQDAYCSSGHGDFVFALQQSGYRDTFIKNGGKHLWYSNVDNLGATISELILGYHTYKNAEMTVELAQKYPGDKGGAPAIVDGRLEIVEQFKFPTTFNQDLISVFNTATYIFRTASLGRKFDLPFYYVEKKVGSRKIIQFERLTGDISMFLKTEYIIVNRKERFFPIKTPQDLENNRHELKKRFAVPQ